MNKRGQFSILIFVMFFLITIYALLFIPIPAFTKLRMFINYFLIVILWVALQFGLLFGYYKIGNFFFRGISSYKQTMHKWNNKIKNAIQSS
jgi:hypothetical protein